MTYLDPIALRLIQRLVVEYEYQVVISSSWRHRHRYKTIKDFRLIFLIAGCQDIADALHPDWCTPKFSKFGTKRGYEIRDWLTAHPDIEDYLIIDDDSNMLPEQKDRFIHVKSSDDGFSFKNFIDACEISNGG